MIHQKIPTNSNEACIKQILSYIGAMLRLEALVGDQSVIDKLMSDCVRRDAVAYNPVFCNLVISKAQNDPAFCGTNSEIADFIGCSERAVYKWKTEYPEFAEAYQIARRILADRQIRHIAEGAKGAVSITKKRTRNADGTITEEEIIKKEAPDTKAAIFLLKNLAPDEWTDRHDIDMTSGGEVVRPLIVFAEPKQPKIIDVTPEKIETGDDTT